MKKPMSVQRKRRMQMILIAVILLGGIGFVAVQSNHPMMQLFMTVDVQHPTMVRFVVGYTKLALPFDPLTGMKCNGVAFKQGYPEQDFYTGIGWYADVPAILPGALYHCTVSGLFSSQRLDLPMRAATALTISAPANDAPLARTTPFDITFACGGGTPYGSASDRAGHVAMVYGIGCGDVGRAHFRPVARDGFVAGPGTINLKTQQITYGTAQDWPNGFSIIYVSSTTLSVQWQ